MPWVGGATLISSCNSDQILLPASDLLNFSDQKFFNKILLQIPPKMTTSPASEAIMSDQDYCQIATDTFQGYADENLKGKPLWESIKIDFKDWTKKHWNAINGKTWSVIKGFCIPRGVWIEDYKVHGSQSEILMKLVSTTKYDTELKDWDMDRIKEVENIYGKVSRGIHLQMQKLLGNIPDKQQQF